MIYFSIGYIGKHFSMLHLFFAKKKSLDGNVAYVLKKQRNKLNPISQYMINLFKGTEMFYKRNVVNGIFLQ